jgi:hypothetical protein
MMLHMHARCVLHFNVEWEDALLYHVTLNTERLPVDVCIDTVCHVDDHPKFWDDPATTYSALADKLLEAKINSAEVGHVIPDPAGTAGTIKFDPG